MNDDPVPDGLRELSWRRKLTPSEAARLRAWVAAHPETQADYEVESALTEALGRLPEAPVASNFTAGVLQEIDREAAQTQRKARGRFWHWRTAWLPRAAMAAVVVGVAIISAEQVHKTREQAEFAKRLASVPVVADVPRPEILQDFDAIRQLSNPVPDEQLLSLMQ